MATTPKHTQVPANSVFARTNALHAVSYIRHGILVIDLFFDGEEDAAWSAFMTKGRDPRCDAVSIHHR